MKILNNINECFCGGTSVALGTFDGLHIGHRSVVSLAVNYANKNSLRSVIVSIIRPDSTHLISQKDFESELDKIGVDYVLYIELDSVRNLTPNEFFGEYLLQRLNAEHVSCGFNYRFGKDAIGDVEMLSNMCRQKNIDFSVASPVMFEGDVVSSSRIKLYLQNGEIAKANKMLVLPFGYDGNVQTGNHLGGKLNFSTANLSIDSNRFVPKNGVYFARVKVASEIFDAVCNLGRHPTVNQTEQPILECHLLDFDRDIYSQYIVVQLLEFCREEKTFDSIEALCKAVESDKTSAYNYFSKK